MVAPLLFLAGIYKNSRMGTLALAISGNDPVVVICLLFMYGTFLSIITFNIIRLLRRGLPKGNVCIGYLAGNVAALCGLLLISLLLFYLQKTYEKNALVLFFGLRGEANWIFSFSYFSLAGFAVSAYFIKRVSVHPEINKTERITYFLNLAGLLVLTGFIVHYRMFLHL